MGYSPRVDESSDRLRRAGWSVGDIGTASRWLVCGSNGANLLEAWGRTQAEAWRGARRCFLLAVLCRGPALDLGC